MFTNVKFHNLHSDACIKIVKLTDVTVKDNSCEYYYKGQDPVQDTLLLSVFCNLEITTRMVNKGQAASSLILSTYAREKRDNHMQSSMNY